MTVSSVRERPRGGGGRPRSCQQDILPETPIRLSLSGSEVEWARWRESVCCNVRRMSGKTGLWAVSASQHSPISVWRMTKREIKTLALHYAGVHFSLILNYS